VDSTPALDSGHPEFKSQPRDQQSWMKDFVILLSSSRQKLGLSHKLCHDPFSISFPVSLIILSFNTMESYQQEVWLTKPHIRTCQMTADYQSQSTALVIHKWHSELSSCSVWPIKCPESKIHPIFMKKIQIIWGTYASTAAAKSN
jgi:hypothetical protein